MIALQNLTGEEGKDSREQSSLRVCKREAGKETECVLLFPFY